jgi:hypothetical protein
MSILQEAKLIDRIRARGHWHVVIRPTSFQQFRIPSITDLYPIIEKCSVRLRVWDYPHVEPRDRVEYHNEYILEVYESDNVLQYWRFFQSGQFEHWFAMTQDWRDRSVGWPADQDWKRGTALYVEDVIFTFTEIFEFATRLSNTKAGDDFMHIEISIYGLKGRELQFLHPRRSKNFITPKKTESEEFVPSPAIISTTRLIAESWDLALTMARELFRRFDWDPSLEILRSYQQELKQ